MTDDERTEYVVSTERERAREESLCCEFVTCVMYLPNFFFKCVNGPIGWA